MNENTPPLPQPSGATCPNCGTAQSASALYCSNCGAPMNAATPPGSLSQTSKTIASIALGCGALMFGAIGGCFALMGAGEGLGAISLLIAIPALAALACLVGIFLVVRKK